MRIYRILVLLLLLASSNAYSQSAFQLLKKGSRIKVARSIVVAPKHARLAQQVALNQSLIQRVEMKANKAIISTQVDLRAVRPMEVAGPNRYLRTVSRAFTKQPGWKKINACTGYNGAHHIVTKSVIKSISGRYNDEMLANAPSVFHPFHNIPEYNELFHGHERQIQLYYTKGIKGIVEDFFHQINDINMEEGFPLYDTKFIEVELMEAELWAKHWGLRWK